jgi:hypothetical protein
MNSEMVHIYLVSKEIFCYPTRRKSLRKEITSPVYVFCKSNNSSNDQARIGEVHRRQLACLNTHIISKPCKAAPKHLETYANEEKISDCEIRLSSWSRGGNSDSEVLVGTGVLRSKDRIKETRVQNGANALICSGTATSTATGA